MQRTEVLIAAMQVAREGHGFNPREAIEHISKLIAEQDPKDELYALKVENFLRLCACIWSLRREVMSQGFDAVPRKAQERQLPA